MASTAAAHPQQPSFMLKVKYALYSALIFFLVANPQTYRATQSFFGVAADGTPSPYAFFAHTAIFFAAILSLMMLPTLA